MKTTFLVTITSAQWVGEIGALMAYTPYTIFHKDKVTLYPHPKFLHKVPSAFHLNQPTHLSFAFFQNQIELNLSDNCHTFILLNIWKAWPYPNTSPSGSLSVYTFPTNCTISNLLLEFEHILLTLSRPQLLFSAISWSLTLTKHPPGPPQTLLAITMQIPMTQHQLPY